MTEPEPQRIVEALLFSSADPLPIEKLKEVSGAPSAKAVREALARIAADCDTQDRPYFLEEVAGGWRFATRAAYAPWLAHLVKERQGRLSTAALETLAIVAYKQPISRAEIEAIRGVAVGPILQTLLERDLIRISGKSEALGHPLLYSTTKQFLMAFGLKSLEDLPSLREFAAASMGTAPKETPNTQSQDTP